MQTAGVQTLCLSVSLCLWCLSFGETRARFVRREAAHLLTRWLLLRDHHYLWLVAGSSPTGLPSRLVLLRLLGELVNFEDVTLQAEERGESLLTHMTFVYLT